MANAMFDAYGGGSYGGDGGYADEELYKQNDGSTGTAQNLDEAAQPKSSSGQYSDSMPNDTNVERENKPSEPSPQPSRATATTAPAPMAGSEQTFGQMEQDGRARPPMPDDLYAQHTEMEPGTAQPYDAGAGMPSQQMPSQRPYGGFTEGMGGDSGQVLPFQPYQDSAPTAQSQVPTAMPYGGNAVYPYAPQPFTPYSGPTSNVPQMFPQGMNGPVGGGDPLPPDMYGGDMYGGDANNVGDANYGGDSGDTSGFTPPMNFGGPVGGGGDTLPPDMFGNYATFGTSGGDDRTNGLTPNMFGSGNQSLFGNDGGDANYGGDSGDTSGYTPPAGMGGPVGGGEQLPNDVGDANYAPDTSGFPGGDRTMSTPQPFTPYTPPARGTDTFGNPSPLGNDEMIFGRPDNGGAPAAYQPPAYIPPDEQQFAPSPFSPYEPPPIQRPDDGGYPQNSPAPVQPTVAPTMTPTPAIQFVTPPTTPAQPTYSPPASPATPPATPPAVTPAATPPATTTPPATSTPPATTPPATSGVGTPPASGTTTPSGGDSQSTGAKAPVVTTGTQGTVTNTGTNTGTGAGTNTSKSTFDLLQSLIAGAGGKGQGSELRAQAMKAASDRLAAPNPYGEAQYKAQYENQARGINDQFATSQRRLSDEMAARGLYGSVGKDFNSGRAADLNIGQRNALSDMSMNLANEQARNQAAYQQQGIDQALAASGLDQNSAMQYINTLMGYGQNAFNNDLATNSANSRDAQAQQDFLLQMLKAGYGG